MSTMPYVKFYSESFLTGVAGLTMHERGCYITLLAIQHQTGHLSEKTICLSCGVNSLSDIPDVISKFKRDDQGLFYNERMELEIEKANAYIDSRTKNGNLGGRPRKDQSNNHMVKHKETICKPYAKPYDNHNDTYARIDISSSNNSNSKKRSSTFVMPTVEEVSMYCKERKNNVNAQYFCDFYESKGWKVGKEPMKNWQAAIRTWEKNEQERNPQYTKAERPIQEQPKPRKLKILDGGRVGYEGDE